MTPVDPRIVDEPITGHIDAKPPSWLLIAAAWCAGLALIIATWSF